MEEYNRLVPSVYSPELNVFEVVQRIEHRFTVCLDVKNVLLILGNFTNAKCLLSDTLCSSIVG